MYVSYNGQRESQRYHNINMISMSVSPPTVMVDEKPKNNLASHNNASVTEKRYTHADMVEFGIGYIA